MRALLFGSLLGLVGCGAGIPAAGPSTPSGTAVPAELSPEARLERGRVRLSESRYAEADADLRAAAEGSRRAEALLALSELESLTGRYDEAVRHAREAAAAGAPAAEAARREAEALRATGALAEAAARLSAVKEDPNGRAARLLLGEILLELGKRAEAAPVLMSLIEDYNQDRIAETDGPGLALVGRAAHLLRSPRDANDAFNQAERAGEAGIATLLYRAELFLEKYDPGHAEEVLTEALARAPRHPVANVLMAEVRLDQALDFDEAERLARVALAENPKLTQAYFVLAGIAIRDQDLDAADREIAAGLRWNARDLPLLSLRAVVRFLREDEAGFAQARRDVLARNPEYATMYEIIGEFADWEHRYDEIVVLMREATALDPEDAKAEAQLGFNLIRSGNDRDGVAALDRAFRLDPFNVRVFNTLGLYEKVIPKQYVSVAYPRFVIRYHNDERAVLERYVPDLLNRAFDAMVKSYGFTPEVPIGVELYAEREHFGIRTSGLPNIAIQGVCFGRTLASMSPANESFNLGMTLWHELSHVFHIQMSRSRVPRWFTEGLAEYETIVARPEWLRENDPDLFRAMQNGKLPALGNMSRAFTRAEELDDVAMAYYASSQILVMMADRYGHDKLAEMLRQWGKGRTSSEVMQQVLGASSRDLDAQFRAFAEQRLSRFEKQFVPEERGGRLEKARAEADKSPRDPKKHVKLALAWLREGDAEKAEQALATVERLAPKNADARYLRAELAASEHPERAIQILNEMIRDGQDGYAVSFMLGKLLIASGASAAGRQALEAAHRFDPAAAAPLYGLAELAVRDKDEEAELSALRRLGPLEQHEGRVYRRLLELLSSRKLYDEAVQIGEAAIWADTESATTHRLFGEALAAKNERERAVFELESAILGRGEPSELARAHASLAELYRQQGRARLSREQREKARALGLMLP